ncbi:hypothetical protein E4U54_004345 [Claviceps lovelessii]|nr:hypothetical protein E4U54_004345 [Claviceps lovelessii]
MQLFTSATLAAIALFAGHTFAHDTSLVVRHPGTRDLVLRVQCVGDERREVRCSAGSSDMVAVHCSAGISLLNYA